MLIGHAMRVVFILQCQNFVRLFNLDGLEFRRSQFLPSRSSIARAAVKYDRPLEF